MLFSLVFVCFVIFVCFGCLCCFGCLDAWIAAIVLTKVDKTGGGGEVEVVLEQGSHLGQGEEHCSLRKD